MTARIYLGIASAAVVAGIVAMFLVYMLVYRGAGEFRENCDKANGIVLESSTGIICQVSKEEVPTNE